MLTLTTIDVEVPVDVAFDYYCDQASLQHWIPGGGILEFTPVTPPPKQVGSQFRIAYRSFGLTFRLLAEVKTLETNRLSVKERVSGAYKSFRYEMHFTPTGPDSCRLDMRVSAELPGGVLGRLVMAPSAPFVRRDMQGGLARFKARVEARTPALAPVPVPVA